jgi:hypothetical protein
MGASGARLILTRLTDRNLGYDSIRYYSGIVDLPRVPVTWNLLQDRSIPFCAKSSETAAVIVTYGDRWSRFGEKVANAALESGANKLVVANNGSHNSKEIKK